jgi:hypothetical protein
MGELIIIGVLIFLLGFQEWTWRKHVKDLEDKVFKSNPQLYWTLRNEEKRPQANEIMKENTDEQLLTDIPMMEFKDRNFNIQLEGDSETPMEARARNER